MLRRYGQDITARTVAERMAVRAAANGHTVIDLGCDSFDAKVQRGARLEPLWGLVLQPSWEPQVAGRARRSSLSTLDTLAAWDAAVRTPTAQRVQARLTLTDFPAPRAPGAGSAAGTRPPRA